ncbi:hypothetical protein THH46_30340 [Pseudomonas sp. NA13]
MALEDHDLALILPMGQPECIQVFYRVDEDEADLYVLDEFNALWQQHVPYHDEQSLLVPLQRFCNRCCTVATPCCRWMPPSR